MLNRRAEQLIGRVVPLERAIVDGSGRVQIADAFWDVRRPGPARGHAGARLSVDGMTSAGRRARV